MSCDANNCTKNQWSEMVYPGQVRLYHGVEPNAGSWPMHYFKKTKEGEFVIADGCGRPFEIAHPSFFDFEQELKIVEEVQRNLTIEQKNMATFWGTGIPLNQLTPIALTLITTYAINPLRAARIMAAVQDVINDAFVITWHYKYLWDYPRPCQLNLALNTFLNTPKFPAYPSGHSVVSAATMEVLGYYFPAEQSKLYKLAQDASISRLYGGIHFRPDLDQGLRLGKQIGQVAVCELKKQWDKDGIMVDLPRADFLNAPIMPKYN